MTEAKTMNANTINDDFVNSVLTRAGSLGLLFYNGPQNTTQQLFP